MISMLIITRGSNNANPPKGGLAGLASLAESSDGRNLGTNGTQVPQAIMGYFMEIEWWFNGD